MNMQLFKIKVWPGASKKSVCFIAELRVDGDRVADIINYGEGQPTKILPGNAMGAAMLKQVKTQVDLDMWVDEQMVKQCDKLTIDDITGELKLK